MRSFFRLSRTFGSAQSWPLSLKCDICGLLVCHRHDREQFRVNTIGGNSICHYKQINYPSGEIVKRFRCYRCRTKNMPKDMGDRKWPLSDLLLMGYIFTVLIVFAILALVSLAGDSLGFTEEIMESAESLCCTHTLVSLAIFVLLVVYFRWKNRNEE